MKKLAAFLIFLFAVALPANAQFNGCPPGFCSPTLIAATPTCTNSGHSAAFLARTSGLDGTHTTAYTNLLDGLDSDGLTCLMDVLYIFATQDETTARLNLINTNFPITNNGSVTFTVDQGFTGTDASTTKYLRTGYNPLNVAAAGGQYTQGLAHISEWSLTNATNTNGAFGSYISGSVDNVIFPKYSDNNSYYRVNSNPFGGGVANVTATGHYAGNRNGVSVLEYRNGSSVGTVINTQQTIANLEFYAAAANNNGTPNGSGIIIAQASAGAYLDATQTSNFYTRLRTYMTAVGVP